MIDVFVNGKLACTCLPEIATMIVQMLVANIGLEYKVEVKKHEEKEAN